MLDDLVDLFGRYGADHYDEDISQLAHGLQAAALAESAAAPAPLVLAALLHDVGHLLELDGRVTPAVSADEDGHHEARGARYLASLLPTSVTIPVALHVRAKRYLCGVDATYVAQLSEGSVESLERQGGPMSDAEISAFERLAGGEDAVLLRRWDDEAKVIGLDVAPFDHYIGLIEELAAS